MALVTLPLVEDSTCIDIEDSPVLAQVSFAERLAELLGEDGGGGQEGVPGVQGALGQVPVAVAGGHGERAPVRFLEALAQLEIATVEHTPPPSEPDPCPVSVPCAQCPVSVSPTPLQEEEAEDDGDEEEEEDVASSGVATELVPSSEAATLLETEMGSELATSLPDETETEANSDVEEAMAPAVIHWMPAKASHSHCWEEDTLDALWRSFDSQDTQLQNNIEESDRTKKRLQQEADDHAKQLIDEQASRVQRPEWGLEDALCQAVRECAELPVTFDLVSPDDERAESALLCIASRAQKFYVGGTTAVARRWLGGHTDRGFMRGHSERYCWMAVVAVRRGAAGGQLEQRCICAARERHPGAIVNKANDSRGLSKTDVNFVYIVVEE